MIKYSYGVAKSCCDGWKLTIYKKEEEETREVVETKSGFETREEAKEFAVNKIKQLKEEE